MPCSHDDCQSDPKWRPIVSLRCAGRPDPVPVRYRQLGYCDQHRESLTIDTFLSDEAFAKLAKTVREGGLGRAQKKRASHLSWEKITPEELAALAARQQHTQSPAETLAF